MARERLQKIRRGLVLDLRAAAILPGFQAPPAPDTDERRKTLPSARPTGGQPASSPIPVTSTGSFQRPTGATLSRTRRQQCWHYPILVGLTNPDPLTGKRSSFGQRDTFTGTGTPWNVYQGNH